MFQEWKWSGFNVALAVEAIIFGGLSCLVMYGAARVNDAREAQVDMLVHRRHRLVRTIESLSARMLSGRAVTQQEVNDFHNKLPEWEKTAELLATTVDVLPVTDKRFVLLQPILGSPLRKSSVFALATLYVYAVYIAISPSLSAQLP